MKKCLNKIIKYGIIYIGKENNTKKNIGGNKMTVRELRVKFGTQHSFNKKAFVKEDNGGTQYLYSYYSLIITNYGNTLQFEEDSKLYSNVTMKHVREYLYQVGGWDLAALPKAKLFRKLEENNYIISNIV